MALPAEVRRGETEGGAGRAGEGARGRRRLFSDDAGVLWTAELRRPRVPGAPGQAPSPLILFWSEARACLATLRGVEGLSELTEDDLRRHLQACLSG